MIEFIGYNDARAIKAYNKKNLSLMFIWFGIICFIISIIALIINIYELLFIWGIYLYLLAICLFAMSFSKYDDKAIKELNIKTKHIFQISELKLYRDGKEIKDVKNIKLYSYKTYIFLECKKSYYYIPLNESIVPKENLENAIYEVIHQIDISKIIDEIKIFVKNNEINGEFTYNPNNIIWNIGKYRYKYYIDFIEVYVIKEKSTFNIGYREITHYHILVSEIEDDIKEINQEYINAKKVVSNR